MRCLLSLGASSSLWGRRSWDWSPVVALMLPRLAGWCPRVGLVGAPRIRGAVAPRCWAPAVLMTGKNSKSDVGTRSQDVVVSSGRGRRGWLLGSTRGGGTRVVKNVDVKSGGWTQPRGRLYNVGGGDSPLSVFLLSVACALYTRRCTAVARSGCDAAPGRGGSGSPLSFLRQAPRPRGSQPQPQKAISSNTSR